MIHLKILLWYRRDGSAWCHWKNWLRVFFMCVCVCVLACMRHFNGSSSTDRTRRPRWENPSLHSNDTRFFDRPACKSSTCKPAPFSWPTSKRSSAHVDKFPALAHIVLSASPERRDEKRPVPPLWLHPSRGWTSTFAGATLPSRNQGVMRDSV